MQSADNASPYPGPRPFTTAEREQFFGRARERRDLAALVIAHPLTVLHGPLGSGKTSLLAAGLVPELERAGFEVLPVARVGGLLPPGTDAARLRNVFSFSVLLHWAQEGERDDLDALARHTLASYLRSAPAHSRDGAQRPLAIVLDQLEELFTSYPVQWEQRAAFLREVAECLQDDRAHGSSERPLRVLLSIRDDKLAELERFANILPDLLRVRYRLEGLDVQMAAEAIGGPARHLFQKTDADQVARQLAQRRVRLPSGKQTLIPSEHVDPMHIQLACDERWRRGGRTGPLNKPLDPDEALARFYDLAVHRARKGWGAERKIRRWIDEKLITPEGARAAVMRGKRGTAGLNNDLVDNLEAERVIRSESRLGNQWYELAHERLVEPARLSNRTWFKRHASRRRAWRFVFWMLLFAGAVAGLAYLGKLGLRMWDSVQGEKTALEQRLASLDGDRAGLAEDMAGLAGELAGERLRVRTARLADEIHALSADALALQGVVVEMGRFRPSARDVDTEAETLTNYVASGEVVPWLLARVETADASLKALQAELDAAREAHKPPEKKQPEATEEKSAEAKAAEESEPDGPDLKAMFEAIEGDAEALEPELTRLRDVLDDLRKDHARYAARLAVNLEGFEAPPRAGSPLNARVREQSRAQWREGLRSLLAGDLDGARARFQRAIDRDVSNPAPRDMLARLAWSQGQVDAAADGFKDALAQSSTYAPALAGMGRVYLHRGELADATRCLRRALAFQPNYGPAVAALSALAEGQRAPDAKKDDEVDRDNPCKKAPAAAPPQEAPAEPAPAD